LPHHQWKGKTYFITFRTYGGYELSAGSRDIVLETCLAGNAKLFTLLAVVVMPDHVHMALKPMSDADTEVPIPKIMHGSKAPQPPGQQICRKGRTFVAG